MGTWVLITSEAERRSANLLVRPGSEKEMGCCCNVGLTSRITTAPSQVGVNT
jgi:hypothetical protein